MLKQIFTLFFCSILLMSCSYLEQQYKKDTIQEIDTVVDFNSVDAFPLFPNCKHIPTREKQQICFQLEMSQHIYGALKEYQLNAKDVVRDTVLIKLIVDSAGKTSVSTIKISIKTKELLPEFDSILRASLRGLPELQPAIKRNMTVASEFTLPIILTN